MGAEGDGVIALVLVAILRLINRGGSIADEREPGALRLRVDNIVAVDIVEVEGDDM